MRYQICHPNININNWLQVDVLNLGNLIETHSFDEVLTRTSIGALESNGELSIVNLGTLRIDIEHSSEIKPTIKILKEALTKTNL